MSVCICVCACMGMHVSMSVCPCHQQPLAWPALKCVPVDAAGVPGNTP